MSTSDFIVSTASLTSPNSRKPSSCPACQDNTPSFTDLLGNFEAQNAVAPTPPTTPPTANEAEQNPTAPPPPTAHSEDIRLATARSEKLGLASQITNFEELSLFQQLPSTPLPLPPQSANDDAPVPPAGDQGRPSINQTTPIANPALDGSSQMQGLHDLRPAPVKDASPAHPAKVTVPLEHDALRIGNNGNIGNMTPPSPVNETAAQTTEKSNPASKLSLPIAANELGREQVLSRSLETSAPPQTIAAKRAEVASNDNSLTMVQAGQAGLVPSNITPAQTKPALTEALKSQTGTNTAQERSIEPALNGQNAANNNSQGDAEANNRPAVPQSVAPQSVTPLSKPEPSGQAAPLLQAFDNMMPKTQASSELAAYTASASQMVEMNRPAGLEIPTTQGNNQTMPQVPLNNLAVHITARAKAGHQRFEIRLDPPELGKIDIKIEIGRDGQTLTHLAVEKPETLDLLRQDARQLERALANAGLDSREGNLSFSLRDENANKKQTDGSDQDETTDAKIQNETDDNEATISQTVTLSTGIDVKV